MDLKFSKNALRNLRIEDSKYERILLLTRHILVMPIRIFKYDVFWLGVFSVP